MLIYVVWSSKLFVWKCVPANHWGPRPTQPPDPRHSGTAATKPTRHLPMKRPEDGPVGDRTLKCGWTESAQPNFEAYPIQHHSTTFCWKTPFNKLSNCCLGLENSVPQISFAWTPKPFVADPTTSADDLSGPGGDQRQMKCCPHHDGAWPKPVDSFPLTADLHRRDYVIASQISGLYSQYWSVLDIFGVRDPIDQVVFQHQTQASAGSDVRWSSFWRSWNQVYGSMISDALHSSLVQKCRKIVKWNVWYELCTLHSIT